MREYLSSANEVLDQLGSSHDEGLSSGEAEARLAKNGPNKLKEQAKTPL